MLIMNMADKKGEVKWIGKNRDQEWKDIQVDPKYSKVGERIRHITPTAFQCSMFCGGKQCKYDNPTKWKDEEMAIRGLYSSWITGRILAMARPSTYAINEFDVLKQFKSNNISAIINLQHPGEHASCGFGLEPGGFSYVPQEFMDEDVFFYNFCWDDYGVRALQSIVDMVKVMDFALADGKVAIHCHAGLGRTGVLIACYFVYSQRMKADSAINTVRAKRPKAIQTRGQIACVRDFETYLKPMWIIFANSSTKHKPFSLMQFLKRQAHILHGEEERDLRYVPKVVFVICQRLLELAGIDFQLRSVTVLRRRAFTSLSLSDESSDLLSSEGDASSGKLDASSKEHKNKSDSDFDVGHIFDKKNIDDDVTDGLFPGELKDNVYYDSFGDGPEELCGMDELEPEQAIHHSVSESVLLGSNKAARFNIDTHRGSSRNRGESLKLFNNEEVYVSCENARASDSDETISIKIDKESSVISGKSENPRDSSVFMSHETINGQEVEAEVKRRGSQPATQDQSNSSEAVTEEKGFKAQNSIELDSSVLTNVAASLAPKVNLGRIMSKLEKYKNDLNESECTWDQLSKEENPFLLSCLLWHWFEHLEPPVIVDKDLEIIAQCEDDSLKGFESLDRDKRKTLQVVMLTFLKLASCSDELKDKALQKISTVFTRMTTMPKKSRSERAALIRDTSGDNLQTNAGSFDFFSFLDRLCTTKVFYV
ncbi:protein tyrosine phosphatase domain-containing protein 1-like [Rhopilema esculentum]|uniref:protein tyrosine phosphatase domain-containing protein 1-like n=1 Tax=Rhopilema esculentum TaxID=499914 RepID=UPI0031DF2612